MSERLDKVGDVLIRNIQRRFDTKKLIDTSGAKNSLQRTSTDNNLKILGSDYIEYLNRGRRPGGKHPFNKSTGESFLLAWARRKTSSEKNAKQLAYLVGRKLVREGSEIFKNREKGLMLEEVAQLGVDLIFKSFVDIATTKIIGAARS